MTYFDHPWFTLGILIAIALLATVSALVLQMIFGRTVITVFAGPAIAAMGVLIFAWSQSRAPRGFK